MDRERSRDAQAVNVLERFSSQIGWVVDSVMRSFELEPHFRDDVRQEAEIMVLSYADLFEEPIWGSGRLFRFVKKAEGDEKQVRAMLARQLRIDLAQIVMRQITKNDGESMIDSLDELVEEGLEPVDSGFEDRELDAVNGASSTSLHDRYPNLALNILDGYTQEQIAEAYGVSHKTVKRRISKEKRAFLIAYLIRAGLVVEGDEESYELEEAYGHLVRAGR